MINLKDVMTEYCKVMGVLKIKDEDMPNNGKLQTSLGEYIAVDITHIKREIDEKINADEPLVYLMGLSFFTGKTTFSGYFVMKAQELCELMNWDYNFQIYENANGDMPIILINEQNIGFIIAPRVGENKR